MENPFKLEITLKQHTPLIHFQHNQDGATLRATELKPKLDRFIINQIGWNNIPIEWKQANQEKQVLKYSIKIVKLTENLPTKIEKNPLYFGDMGKPDNEKKMFVNSNVSVEVFSFLDGLLAKIKSFIPLFFATHNFGTRQNKGFGSFYPISFDQKYKKIDDVLTNNYHLEIDTIDDDNIFGVIDTYYKRLKSGLNHIAFGAYQKSSLYIYLDKNKLRDPDDITNRKTITWEKKEIKARLLGIVKPEYEENNKTPYFVRPILGLMGSFTFKETAQPKKQEYSPLLDSYEVDVKSDEIERIPSQVLFKVYKESKKTKIFILFDKIDGNLVKNKAFVFNPSFMLKIDKGTKDGKMFYITKPISLSKYKANPSDFTSLINKAVLFESSESAISGQKTRFDEFIKRNVLTLKTPNIDLYIEEIVSQFNNFLGKSYKCEFNNTLQYVSVFKPNI